MEQQKLVSGIFFQLKPSRETFESRTTKWWIAFIIILSMVGLILFGFVVLSASANSGLGLQVVGYTFLFGFIVLLGLAFRRVSIKDQIFSLKQSNIVLIAIFGVMIAISYAIGILTFSGVEESSSLATSLALGGTIFGVIVVLLYEGYPILSNRGSPGYVAMSGLLIVLVIVYMTAISWWIVPFDPTRLDVGPYGHAPTPAHPLGTTALGQDLLSRVMAGGGIMLQVAVISVLVCFSIGVPAGLAASYSGGAVDRVSSLVMDSIFAFPGLVLAIAIAAMLGPGVTNMALAIAVVYIPSYFRVVRSQVLTVKELPYVEAAIIMGARDRDIIFRYILPNILPSAVVVMSINFADAVLTAAGLTFVGLGLPVDVPDWGWDLTFGSHELIAGKWWSITFPGIMIVILALGFTLAGEGLNEVLTPKLKE